MPEACTQQANSATAWYLWRGDIFRVPLSTLQRMKRQGGWDLHDVAAESRALFFIRPRAQSEYAGSLTSEWLRKWDLLTPYTNPPHMYRIPANVEYLGQFAMDTAYIPPREHSESCLVYKRCIYNTMHVFLSTTNEPLELRIARLWPNTDLETVWQNVHETPVSGTVKVTWYQAIHDIVSKHERRHKIRLVPSDLCGHCNRTDTLQHRLTECGEGPQIWEWTRQRLASILRTDWRRIPPDWLLRPTFKMWPPQRRRAVCGYLPTL